MDIKKVFHGSVQERITLELGVTDSHVIYHPAEPGFFQVFPYFIEKIFAKIRNLSAKNDQRWIYGTDQITQGDGQLPCHLLYHSKSGWIAEGGSLSQI